MLQQDIYLLNSLYLGQKQVVVTVLVMEKNKDKIVDDDIGFVGQSHTSQ